LLEASDVLARWPSSRRTFAPSEHWRELLFVTRLARDATAFAGDRNAAGQVAYALSGADASLCRSALLVIASQSAKGTPMPRISEIGELLVLWSAAAGAARPKSRRSSVSQLPLPVEAARAVPILDVLSRYGVVCRATGREHLGHCPFGDHRRQHLYVNPQKGLWKCWPCDLGGDGIAFVMRLKGLSFADVVRELAA
jgi:hypothetical protein